MKRFLCVFLVAIMLVLSFGNMVFAQGDITVSVNGKVLTFDVQPQIINDRTMVPMRGIFEALGATVEWNDATKTVTATDGLNFVEITIGSDVIKVNGKEKTIDTPPCIVDGRTLVPARFVAEAMGCEVKWDGATRTVYITKEEIAFYEGTMVPDYGKLYNLEPFDTVVRSDSGDILRNYRVNKGNYASDYIAFLEKNGWTYLKETNGYFLGKAKVYTHAQSKHYVSVTEVVHNTASDMVIISVSEKPEYIMYENTDVPDYGKCVLYGSEPEVFEQNGHICYRYSGVGILELYNYGQILNELGWVSTEKTAESEYQCEYFEKDGKTIRIYRYISVGVSETYIVIPKN